MSFFEPIDPPGPPDPPPPRPRWAPPDSGRLGGFVPLRLELARTDEVVVLLGPMEAHPQGVAIRLQTRSRQPHAGPMGFGPDEASGPLRLGVAFADGRTTETSRRVWMDPGAPTEGPVLTMSGGGGGGGRYDQELWLWPLPPPGPVRFVVLWEDAGIPETSVEVDAQFFLDAAEQAQTLWEPLTPEEEQAAHRALFERHRARGGSFSAGTLSLGFQGESPDDPSGDDDEYL